jgi:rod shape-determining protein MreD
MVRSIIIGLIILFNLILQSTLFQWVEIYGVVPNTSLILVMSFAIYSGRNRGAVIGFLMGILQDIIFGRTIGLNALVFMVIGYLIGLMDQKISKDNLLIPFVLTMLATVFYETINLLLLFLLGCRIELLNKEAFP